VALAVGGAGASFPRLELLVEAAGLTTLLYFALTHRSWRLDSLSRFALAIAALIILLPIVQLVPLPPAIWTLLPGRELATQIGALTGFADKWRPISLDPEGTIRSVITLLPAVAMLVATLFLPMAERLRLVWVVVGFALLSAALGAAQFASGGGMTPYPSAHQGDAIGLFVNRNHQAVLLLLTIPLTAALGACRAARLRQPMTATILTIAGFTVLALTILATTSRMGLALIPIAVACGLFVLLRGRANWRIAAPALLGLGLIALVTLVSGMFGRTLARFSSLEEGRFDYWRDIDWALQQYGLAGTGFGTFVPIYQSAESLDLVSRSILNHAHNDYLEIALEGGWTALALLAAFLVFLALAVRRLMETQASLDRRLVSLAALTGILIIMIFSVVDYPLRMPALSVVFALLCGLLLPTVGQVTTEPPHIQSRTLVTAEQSSIGAPASQSRSVATADQSGTEVRALQPRRRSRGKRRRSRARARAVLLTVAALPVAGVVVSSGMSSHELIAQRHASASRWAPWSATAYERRATDALVEGNVADASRNALRALARSPMSLPAIRTLGIIDAESRRDDRSFKLMGMAAVLGWRDTLTQMWVMQAAIASGEGDKAVQRAEALLRQGTMSGPAYAMLIQGTANPAVLDRLVRALTANPGWRRELLTSGGQLAPSQFDAFERLLRALTATDLPPTDSETAPYIRQLLAARDSSRAVKVWSQLRGSQLIANGEFEGVEGKDGTLPESWFTARTTDIRADVAAPTPARVGNALHRKHCMYVRAYECAQRGI
jgi:O-antigen ligase